MTPCVQDCNRNDLNFKFALGEHALAILQLWLHHSTSTCWIIWKLVPTGLLCEYCIHYSNSPSRSQNPNYVWICTITNIACYCLLTMNFSGLGSSLISLWRALLTLSHTSWLSALPTSLCTSRKAQVCCSASSETRQLLGNHCSTDNNCYYTTPLFCVNYINSDIQK